MTLNDTRSRIPFTCFTSVINYSLFSSTDPRFWVNGQFETSALNDPKWLWTQQVPYICCSSEPGPPNFTHICSTVCCFGATDHSVISAVHLAIQCSTEWLTKDLECYEVKGIPLYLTGTRVSQISHHCILQPTVFELQAIWDKGTEKNLNTMRSKVPHIYSTSTHGVPDFNAFHSTDIHFRVIIHYQTTAPIDPKSPCVNTTRPKVPLFVPLVLQVTIFTPFALREFPFLLATMLNVNLF